MNEPSPSTLAARSPVATLRRFARARKQQEAPPEPEHCELCAAPIPPQHAHLVETANHRLVCACEACAILFDDPEAKRYRRVPRRIRWLRDLVITEAMWEGLHIPIGLAFFFHSTPAKKVVAMYPGPAGATESLLSLDAWQDLVAANPILGQLEPDVEALLVNRVGQAHDCFTVPIDECYKLVGLIRTHWRGLSGGAQVWGEIAKFFASLKERADTHA